MKPNGYILFEDTHRVIIATGFETPSENAKTGPMVQIYILVRSENPLQAVKSGRDRLVCGNCPLRGELGIERGCYVNLGQSPLAVWDCYQRGNYPQLPSVSLFAGYRVRFGAYGDPTHLPFTLAKSIAETCDGWTGYTHQWRKPSFQPWKSLIMASVETEADKALAESLGWSTFQVIPKNSPKPSTGIECLSDSHGIQCHDCLKCNGTRTTPKSIWIEAHGSGAKYV